MIISRINALTVAIVLAGAASAFSAEPARKTLAGHVPAAVARLAPQGRLPSTNQLYLAIGLPLRNQAALDELLRQLQDPSSANYHKYLTPEEYTARFGPTEGDYQTVIQFAEANGLKVAGTHPNRVVLDVEGSVSNIERAFQITLRVYQHPAEARTFYAPDVAPSVGAGIPVLGVSGLDDFALPHPKNLKKNSADVTPNSGSGPSGSYAGHDFRAAYVPGTTLNGSGQSVALLEFDGYYANDIASYENTYGLPAVTLTNVAVGGGVSTPGGGNSEVALDIEMVIAMAPGLSKVIVYEAPNPSPWPDLLNRIANDNFARQISCSWGGGSPDATSEQIFQQMAAQGQSFFNASGDSDAFSGSIPFPSDSTNITQVGGTTLTTTGPGGSWSSETVWNWGVSKGKSTGSSGGISTYYPMPDWQQGIDMTTNHGSTTLRNVPDVALTADNILVTYNNGQSGVFGGTSAAAPLWAAFTALANQQAAAAGLPSVGFINPAVYAIGKGTNYVAGFHDITIGNNFTKTSAPNFSAVPGYDLCTGWGTPAGTNLINALAPALLPYFISQPTSQTVTNGASLAFNVTVGGPSPLGFRWLFNGTSLPAGGNISGTTSNVLSIAAASTDNAGNYRLVASNNSGSVTSSVAVLSVGFAPGISAQPANLTILSDSNAIFSATVGGSAPLVYQWQKNGTNLVNGSGISGATTDTLTLTGVTTNSSGNYVLSVTNLFGVRTSSVAALTVVLPPTINGGLTNRMMECGSNVTITGTAGGTAPLFYQWSFDGTPLPGATNASLALTNVHLPNHTVAVTVTNLYASVASNAVLIVNDTKAPVITLSGSNPLFIELGSAFTDLGAFASDVCAGSLPVSVAGIVNTNAVGTNTLTYAADDGNGNTNSATRNVVVRDTTPPAILWSFTNLVLAANTNCVGLMMDVTGTNFIVAADLSGALTISQSPTNNAILPLGTNTVVIAVTDASDNTTFSTNSVVVQDQAPPVFSIQPLGQTNFAGTTVGFSAVATACTPLAWQWFFNTALLPGQTNSTLTLASISPTNAGNYSVVVTASGGSSTSAVAALVMNLTVPDVALISSANPSGFNDNVNFIASLTPANAAGTIQFYTNGIAFDLENLTAGQAVSTNLASLPRGTNVVTAVYSGDTYNLPATNTLAQIVTNHPPVATPAFYSRNAGGALNIAVAELATNWTDVDGDAIALAGFSVSTNGVTLVNNAGTLEYFNANDVADQFVCTISDGWDAGLQTVNIVINPPVDIRPNIIGEGSGGDGSFTLNLAGTPGYTYILEATTNLVSPGNWLPLATNIMGTNNVWQFADTSATNLPVQFYRLKLMQ